MGKIRRGRSVFVWWKGDHSPRHVQVFEDGAFIVRLLDPANMSKSFVHLVALLDVVDCEVRVSVRRRQCQMVPCRLERTP